MSEAEKGLYARAHTKLLELQGALTGRTFTTKDLWDMIGLQNKPEHSPFKKALATLLNNLSNINKDPLLSRDGKAYRFIDRVAPEIQWWNPTEKKLLEIKWPRGIEDSTSFGFEDSIVIYPGDLIVLAGEGNRGKTTFALNFLVENMDNYPCTYYSSEFNEIKFRNRISRFNWVDVMKDGRPKFELLPRQEHYEDLISQRRNNINIIDWIRMDEDPWKIRAVLDRIMSPLDKGICLVVQQKRTYKNVGEGGEGAVDLASVYLILSNQRLKVEKVKEPKSYDPNYKSFGFEIISGGAKFNHIREVKKCVQCNSTGNYRGAECEGCAGQGWKDA